MSKKPITQFIGKRTPAEIAAGINVAVRNARRLFDDAELLAKAGRYPSACALAILSIEEAGKCSVLRRLSTARDDEVKEIWREYRSHQKKNAAWIIMDLVAGGARTLRDLAPIYDKDSDHPAILDTVKQLAFYTDCYAQGNWSQPHIVIDEKLCEQMLTVARILSAKGEVTAREIELWAQHVGGNQTEAGVHAFFVAMQAEGLTPPDDEASIERFLGIKPH